MAGKETPLAVPLARLLTSPDMWRGFAESYLAALEVAGRAAPPGSALIGACPEDAAAAAAHICDHVGYRNWYSIDLRNTPGPATSCCASG